MGLCAVRASAVRASGCLPRRLGPSPPTPRPARGFQSTPTASPLCSPGRGGPRPCLSLLPTPLLFRLRSDPSSAFSHPLGFLYPLLSLLSKSQVFLAPFPPWPSSRGVRVSPRPAPPRSRRTVQGSRARLAAQEGWGAGLGHRFNGRDSGPACAALPGGAAATALSIGDRAPPSI